MQFMSQNTKRKIRYMNTFSMGFISVLDVFLSQKLTSQPWTLSLFDSHEVGSISNPGEHYYELSKSSFCLDDAGHSVLAVRANTCPPDYFSNSTNQMICYPCDYGTYSLKGSTECFPCSQDDSDSMNDEQCMNYLYEQYEKRKKVYMGIFIPICSIVFLLCVWLCYRREIQRRKKKRGIADESWVLSYHKLIKPSLPHLPSDPCSSMDTPLVSSHIDGLPSYTVPSSTSPLSPYNFQLSKHYNGAETPFHSLSESTESLR
jgi:hypothetical protein